MDKIRTLRLDGINMPVIIQHAHMNLAEHASIDKLHSRVDTLAIDVAVKYRGGDLKRGAHAGVLNYMGLYDALCFSPVRTLIGPLETIIDETIAAVEAQAKKDSVELVSTVVTVQRLGLVVGAPELKGQMIYSLEPQLPPHYYRSAGITRVPLQVKVDHSWSQDAEHSKGKNQFPETVQLSFAAVTPAHTLAKDSLAGLYNYIETYKLADAAQDMLVDGPFEIVAEHILENVLRDAMPLAPAMLSVSIVRSGYARCSPTLGVEVWR